VDQKLGDVFLPALTVAMYYTKETSETKKIGETKKTSETKETEERKSMGIKIPESKMAAKSVTSTKAEASVESIISAKSSLRKLIAEKRKNLSGDAIEISDRKIFQNLLAIPEYKKAETIFCFVSTPDEIDTKGIITNALSNNKRVCVPKCEKFGVMHACEIKSLNDLQPGKYGISEPKENCPYIAPQEIDFAIIPCVTCDKQGHRLGYGGGFYDRYIQNQTFTKAALCRKALLSNDIPLEPHDMAVDIVVTD
jgi:5-formyltetrahydrofolate cyclo-ligase